MIKEFLSTHKEYKIETQLSIWPTDYNDGFYICKLKKEE